LRKQTHFIVKTQVRERKITPKNSRKRERKGVNEMRETSTKMLKKTVGATLLCGVILSSVFHMAHAESLFRAGIAYQTAQPYTPRSLFSLPRPNTIGDMVTINIIQTTQINVENISTLSKQQTLEENNTKIFNNIIKKVTGVTQLFPTVDGLNNTTQTDVTAKSRKNYTYTDTITCQVVQVLPNGHLVVQGRKTIFANQEEQTLSVNGIINPYFLDAQNTINSRQVANLQMNVAGRGQITRQQGDGVIGKYFQLFN
jgi:flagellar L-ring protein FlgH